MAGISQYVVAQDGRASSAQYAEALSVGPHSWANRLTLTNSSAYPIVVTMLSLTVQRVTTASVVGLSGYRVLLDGTQATMLLLNFGGPPSITTWIIQPKIVLENGQQIVVQSQNGDTGGTLSYYISIVYNDPSF